MVEERRVVSTMQETFIKQIAVLSAQVATLNSNMDELKESHRGYVNMMISVERNNLKVEEALNEIRRLNSIHSNCGIIEVSKKLEVMENKLAMVTKVMAALGAGLVPIIYKLFIGG